MLRSHKTAQVLWACRRGHHVLLTARLRLETPTPADIPMIMAAACDPEAQRWLRWRAGNVVPEANREELLSRSPGQGRSRVKQTGGLWQLIAVDRASGRVAGSIDGNIRSNEVGGFLAPRFRSRGLGSELFSAAAQFAHHHLGAERVLAATDPANAACIGALLSAGFIPTIGPTGTYRMPDGSASLPSWLVHDTHQPARCGG